MRSQRIDCEWQVEADDASHSWWFTIQKMRVSLCFFTPNLHRHPWEIASSVQWEEGAPDQTYQTSVICVGRGLIVSNNSYRSEQWMGFKPKRASGCKRIYSGVFPPRTFIAAMMDLTVMRAA